MKKFDTDQYLEIFGKVFAPFSLKQPDSTVHGYCENSRNGNVRLYKKDKKLEALVLNNTRQGYFVVTASSTEQGDRYWFSTCSLTEIWLGIEGKGCMYLMDCIQSMKYFNHPAVTSNESI